MGAYLDYNASTPVDERVLEKMTDISGIISAMQTAERTGSEATQRALWKTPG